MDPIFQKRHYKKQENLRIPAKRRLIAFFLLLPLWVGAQTEPVADQVDTSSAGYRIGYQIGGWLPFLLLAAILIYLTVRAGRRGKENPG